MNTHTGDAIEASGELQQERELHYCVRVDPFGRAKSTVRDAAGLASWLKRSRTFFPRDALFVNGRPEQLADYGCLSAEQVARIQFSLEAETSQLRQSVADDVGVEYVHPPFHYELGECRAVH